MMSETKFTKGEWIVFEKETSPFDRCQVNNLVRMPESKKTRYGASFYASIGGFDYDTQKEEAEANAHLIAAAPEMYEMLERVTHAQQYADNEIEHSDLLHDLYDEITKLLAKARGEK